MLTMKEFKQNLVEAFECHDLYVKDEIIEEFVALNFDTGDLPSWTHSDFEHFTGDILGEFGDFWYVVKERGYIYPQDEDDDDEWDEDDETPLSNDGIDEPWRILAIVDNKDNDVFEATYDDFQKAQYIFNLLVKTKAFKYVHFSGITNHPLGWETLEDEYFKDEAAQKELFRPTGC